MPDAPFSTFLSVASLATLLTDRSSDAARLLSDVRLRIECAARQATAQAGSVNYSLNRKHYFAQVVVLLEHHIEIDVDTMIAECHLRLRT